MHARAVSRALHTLLAVAVVASRTTWRAERKTTMTYKIDTGFGFGFELEKGFDKGFDASKSDKPASNLDKGFDPMASKGFDDDGGFDSGFDFGGDAGFDGFDLAIFDSGF